MSAFGVAFPESKTRLAQTDDKAIATEVNSSHAMSDLPGQSLLEFTPHAFQVGAHLRAWDETRLAIGCRRQLRS